MNTQKNPFVACTYRLSAKGIILIDKKLMMVMEGDDDGWDLPGGGIEHGETIRSGFIREIKEEVSLDVIETSKQPSITHIARSPHPDRPHTLWVAYNCEALGQAIAADDVKLRFVAREEFESIQLFSLIEEIRDEILNAAWPDHESSS